MKKFILKRPNGRVVSISDEKPVKTGNFEVEEAEVDDIEEVKRSKAVWLREGVLVLEPEEDVSSEVQTILDKLTDKGATLKDAQEAIEYLLRKHL